MRLHNSTKITMQKIDLHFILFIILVLAIFGSGVLVLLVLRHKVVHVGLGLSELHLVHALASVPVQESLAPEHSSELLGHALEHLLDGGGVANEGGTHLEALGGNVANGRLDVVGDPLDEVRGVLVLHINHLLVNLFGGHAASEHAGSGEVAAVTGIGGTHHVLGVEHLLGQLGHGQSTVLLGATAGQWHETNHEEVQTRERNHVHGKFAQVRVELTRETKTRGGARHRGGNKVVQVTVCRGGELQGTEANVVQGFVIQNHDFIGVLDKLVHRRSGVVRLNHGVRHLGGREHGEGEHNPVGVFLTDLRDKQSAHTGTGATAHGVSDLKTLEAVAGFRFLADDVQHGVDQLSALGVVALGPVVAGTGLSENEVIRTEKLTERSRADRVHGTGLKVHQNSAWHVTTTSGFVVVHVDALELKIRVAFVGSGRVNAVLIGDNLPELSADLVAALASLDVNEFAHIVEKESEEERVKRVKV